MTPDEAMAFLNANEYSGTKFGIKTISTVMERLGNPQDKLKFIHVAGTNGKGSTSTFVESILREAGYKTGLYTSPYLESFTERIKVLGNEIAWDDLCELTEKVSDVTEEMAKEGLQIPTIFERITAVGFLYFAQQQCDIVILEVGMGGRLDATNCIHKAELSMITLIDLDHIEFLGDTIEKIAYEKAGIIKKDGIVICYEQTKQAAKVVEAQCKMRGATLHVVEQKMVQRQELSLENGQQFSYGKYADLKIALLGSYQIYNASMAIVAAEELVKKGYAITEQHIRSGLAKARWAGRLELVSHAPTILIDGAHNINGVKGLSHSLQTLFPEKKFTFIFGVLGDKSFEAMIEIIGPLANRFLCVTPDCVRALSAEKLVDVLYDKGYEAKSYDSPALAIEACKKDYADECICAFGSLYYIGEVRAYCRGNR